MYYGKIELGSKIRTLRDMQNGAQIIPKGSIGAVVRRYAGLELYFEHRCEHCHFGDRVSINRVPPDSVELVSSHPEQGG